MGVQMKFVEKYSNFLKKYKLFIIITWVIIIGFSVWLAPKFISETSSDFNVPEDTPSFIANTILKEEFPNIDTETTIVLVIQNPNGTVLNTDIEDFSNSFNTSLRLSEYADMIVSLNGYYFLVGGGLGDAAMGYVSDSNNTMIMEINVNTVSDEELNSFIDFLDLTIDELEPEGYTILLTGSHILFEDMKQASEKDIIVMDSIVLPIALIVLALVLKSFKLMIIPIISVAFSIGTSFFVMYPIAKAMPVFSFVPSVMMSLVIALSIDYALFLLSRYKEELIRGRENFSAVTLMLEHAGHTISVSGITLAICFLGLVFFPIGLLATIGLGAAVCILTTLLINLTLVPALLLQFGNFFSKFRLLKKQQEDKPKTEEERKERELQNQMKSIWFKIGKFATKYSLPIIIVTLIVAIPMSIQMLKMSTSIGDVHILPRQAESTVAFNILKDEFQPGVLAPMYILIETNQTDGIINPAFFTLTQTLIRDIANQTDITEQSFITISWGQGFSIPFFVAYPFINNVNDTVYYSESAILYREMIFNRYTNGDNSTVMIDVQPSFDPFGSYVEDWIKATREIMTDYEDSSGFKFHLAGSSTEIVDSVDLVYKMFPLMIGIIVIIVYVIIALMFKSVFIPLRLIITIGLTLSWIYGLTALIFDVGIFDGIIPVLQDIDHLYWATPVMSFSILIGLGLDYDIFLLSRVSEYRNNGYSERASVIKGLYRTGGIISMAGVIMAIAFSGMIFSSVMILNEFGFILALAVLVDTFIIRTILVPAIMSLASKWNWWPRKLKPPTKDLNDIE